MYGVQSNRQDLEEHVGSLEAEKQGGRMDLGWGDPVTDCKLVKRHCPSVREPE